MGAKARSERAKERVTRVKAEADCKKNQKTPVWLVGFSLRTTQQQFNIHLFLIRALKCPSLNHKRKGLIRLRVRDQGRQQGPGAAKNGIKPRLVFHFTAAASPDGCPSPGTGTVSGYRDSSRYLTSHPAITYLP